VARNGKEVVAVVGINEYRKLTAPTPSEALLGGPMGNDIADLLDTVIAERCAPEGLPRDVER
jgi:hypothetical protein